MAEVFLVSNLQASRAKKKSQNLFINSVRKGARRF